MRVLVVIFYLIFSFDSFSQIMQNPEENENSDVDNNQVQRTILDDSSKVIYSVKTTKFILKKDFSSGDTVFVSPDSSLTNLEKLYRDNTNFYTYQDLGNIGTPLYNIYTYYSTDFSLSSGFNSLDHYYLSSSTPKFYDTRSPFIDLSLFFGGSGRSVVDFVFSRNINKNWNIGLDIHRISSDKQISPSKNKGDKNISSSLFKIFTYHQSNNKKLVFYSDFVAFNHNIFGYGGINIDTESLPLDLFTYDDFEVRLKQIENNEKRSRFNSLLNYKIFSGVEVYNDFKLYSQNISYNDNNFSENRSFYENIIVNQNFTSDSSRFNTLENRVGLRGSLDRVRYNLYANYKNIAYRLTSDNFTSKINRIYIGGDINYLNNKVDLKGSFKIKSTGDYSFRGNIDLGVLRLSYYSGLHETSLFYNRYSSNHFSWDNNFKSSFINILEGALKFQNNSIFFEPFIKIISVGDHVYLSEDKIPTQHNESLLNNQFGITLKVSLFNRVINLDNIYIFNVSPDIDNIINIPKHNNYSKLYYSGNWFKNTIPVQFGVNMYFRSEYNGNAYDPSLQSYYVQNSFILQQYLRYNLFFNMQVKNFRVFLKMTHFNQFDRFNGYFATPYYPGQKKVLDLGVKWYFFN